MARKVKSIKGETVDFDLFEVKKQIGEKPVSADVQNRERFIYSKRRRGSKKVSDTLLKNQKSNEAKVRNAMRASEKAKKMETPEVSVSAKPKEVEVEVKKKRRIVKKK